MFMDFKQVIMVQFFPATGNYVVHYQGAESEHYVSDADIHNPTVNEFINECLKNNYYHENTVHMHTSQVNGKTTVPMRQIIYCKGFTANNQPRVADKGLAFNWVLWIPAKEQLTVNTGVLSTSKDFLIASLEDAPEGVVDFMSACTSGVHVALSNHHCEPDYSDGSVTMKDVSEYFFSTGKIIYGFQNNRVSPFTKQEAEEIGITWYGK